MGEGGRDEASVIDLFWNLAHPPYHRMAVSVYVGDLISAGFVMHLSGKYYTLGGG